MDQEKKSNLANIWLISVVVIIILLLAACTGYYLWANEKNQIVEDIESPDELIINEEPESPDEGDNEAEDEFLAYLKVRNDDYVEIKKVSKIGEISDLFELDQELENKYFLNYLANQEPNFYIYNKEEGNHLVIGSSGQDITSEYPYLKKGTFGTHNFIKVPGHERIVYSLSPNYDQLEGKPLIISGYDLSTIDYITSDLISNDFRSNRPIGWSSDEKDLYVTKIGWEGFDYADLWKVNFESKEVTHIENADKIALGALDVNPGLDLAVGVEMARVDCDECMGAYQGGAPASLYLFDLKNNTNEILIDNSPTLLHSAILSPDGQKIFYSEELSDETNATYVMDVDGANKKRIGENISIQGMSKQGNLLIARSGEYRNYSYKVMDLENNTETPIIIEDLQETTETMFINCNYPLGFSCLY